MDNPEISHYLGEMNDRQARQNTAFDEVRATGVSIQESSTTTLPPNSRFNFIRNGNLLNRDEVGNQITHEQPLYRFPLAAGDVWVNGGADRNGYAPGYEFESGIAFKTSDAPPSGKLLPEDVALLEVGYATLLGQSLTGVPNEDFSYTKDGVALHIEPESADLRIYKDGSAVATLDRDNWEFDPYTDPDFNGDPSDFWLVIPIGDLYGAGDITAFLRLRDADGVAHTKELGTVGVSDAPAMQEYNHQMHLRVEATASVTGGQQAFLGPLQFHNRLDGSLPDRTKTDIIRDATVSNDPGADDWTVVRVYRVDMSRREASTIVSRLRLRNDGQPANAIVRAVHRDFLDFGMSVDPDDDTNWRAGSDDAPSDTRETSIQVLKPSVASSGTVSINTFSDDDGITKIRGEKELTAAIEAGGGESSEQSREGSSPVSEQLYLALVAQIGNSPGDIDLMEVDFAQRW